MKTRFLPRWRHVAVGAASLAAASVVLASTALAWCPLGLSINCTGGNAGFSVTVTGNGNYRNGVTYAIEGIHNRVVVPLDAAPATFIWDSSKGNVQTFHYEVPIGTNDFNGEWQAEFVGHPDTRSNTVTLTHCQGSGTPSPAPTPTLQSTPSPSTPTPSTPTPSTSTRSTSTLSTSTPSTSTPSTSTPSTSTPSTSTPSTSTPSTPGAGSTKPPPRLPATGLAK